MAELYDLTSRSIDGKEIPLSEFEGKTLLIVNVASKCGYTDQYKGLENLYQKYKDRGLMILGFPCNQFGGQEPGTSTEIQQFCSLTYGVSFPMFEKVEVKGANTAPLFKYLTQKLPGIAGSKSIKWNFTKFLISKSGLPIKRFSPKVKPESITKDIEKLLKL